MCASTPTSALRWKHLFSAVEAFVIFAFLYGLTLKIAWRHDMGEHPRVMVMYGALFPFLRPMIWLFLAALIFLLIASPLFLKSHRSAALKAWIIGAAAFLGGLWLVVF